MTVITVERLSHHSFFYHFCTSLVSVACFVGLLPLSKAQQVDLVPSSGMTQNLPVGSNADHRKLMQVRAQAQQARHEAQLAALQRSATQSTDKNNRNLVLQKARRDKEYMRRAVIAVQQQQSINAYKKVKKSQINSWNGKGNKNKITRGVPADFIASLPPLEKESRKKKSLMSGVVAAPGKALKGLASLRPGFLGGKKKKKEAPAEPATQFAPPESLALDSVAPRTPEPTVRAKSEPIEKPKKGGFRIPLISKLTGGKKKDENPYAAKVNSAVSQQQWQAPDPAKDDGAPEEKKGFFKGIVSHIPLVGNKNKNSEAESNAYYGPDGAAEMDEEPKSRFLSKLSLKKNKESDNQETGDDTKEKNTNTRKNIYVVDSKKAQFFPFGKSGHQADAQALGEGTIVRMTKSGDDWSSIELSSGSIGIVRNKHLRRAKAGEIPANMFAHKPKTPYPTTARISKIRSATGKGLSHRYREPVNVPLPDLPAGGTEANTPIGNGLLPPLKESTIQ